MVRARETHKFLYTKYKLQAHEKLTLLLFPVRKPLVVKRKINFSYLDALKKQAVSSSTTQEIPGKQLGSSKPRWTPLIQRFHPAEMGAERRECESWEVGRAAGAVPVCHRR